MKQTPLEQSAILIVDDTPEIIDVLVDALERVGFRLLVAQCGEDVFERIAHVRPDLILLDVLMPGMDGFEVCRRLKARDDTKDIPVLFMSALSDTIDKVKGLELGAVDYITKPFQHEEVLARIKTHLTMQQLQQDLNEALVRRSKRQMEELRTNISRSVPHEWSTPLNIILGFANLIITQHHRMSKEAIVEDVRSISEGAERLHKLIQKYLMYAQIEIIAADPERRQTFQEGETLDPATIITSVAERQAVKAQRTGDLLMECNDPAAYSIRISARYFDMIVQELVENAFKFSNGGAPVRIKTTAANRMFTVSITDQGRGMTPEQIENVGAYMQFERALYEQQGSGLGLIIVKRLVEFHQGKFSVASAGKDQGVTYVVELPLK